MKEYSLKAPTRRTPAAMDVVERHPRTSIKVWRGLRWTSLEYLTLTTTPSHRTLEGTIVGVIRRHPFNLHYKIVCDSNWRTRRVSLSSTNRKQEKHLELIVDHNKWLQHGREFRNLRGAQDIDLNITPSTNTLPIRRLNLAVGKSAETTAAWVQLPDMSIQPLKQVYTNLGNRLYAYSSGNFKTRIKLDRDGLVRDYPPFWKREEA